MPFAVVYASGEWLNTYVLRSRLPTSPTVLLCFRSFNPAPPWEDLPLVEPCWQTMAGGATIDDADETFGFQPLGMRKAVGMKYPSKAFDLFLFFHVYSAGWTGPKSSCPTSPYHGLCPDRWMRG